MAVDIRNINNGEIVDENQKLPIFVSRKMLGEIKKHLPFKLYDKLELNYELGFIHNLLGDKNYKEEVETIIRAKRGLDKIPMIEYKIKHK